MKIGWRRWGLIVALVAVLAMAWSVLREERRVVIGEHVLCIPKENILSSRPPIWAWGMSGVPPSPPGVSVRIEAETVAREVAGFQPYNGELADNLIVSIELLSEDERQSYSDPNMHVFSDPWYGRGLYVGRVSEPLESGYFKIHKPTIESSWRVFKVAPDATKPPPENPYSWYLGGCFNGPSRLTGTGYAISCHSQFFHDDLRFSLHFHGPNVPVVEDIRSFLVLQFEAWKVAERP